ncbi:DUF916 domain-containing protein [Candidatus Nomurabacteria bacterium]|mgnify:CR=1 FL=1|uniref:DUF916 domain-containing protein n=1 Tax=Candidatus Dojkabacteria bacterium TaxID=2099670 RepID=A0A955KWT6_9BACT|nr:DUF916 domain-containing protein [Candidatus Dojkabacteria bacterium]MCB9790379.1 DUF916 domain-containing protein [Candidatus Nomurabacteria bacterium]MCB9803658.1 DUF916 domain-containing protein [Candidatus Nomurabacteria bacterium]
MIDEDNFVIKSIIMKGALLKGLLSLSLLLTSSVLYTTFVSAQEETVGLAISPTTFELTADPGDTKTDVLKVYNPTDAPLTVSMKVEDFAPIGDEGQVVLSEPGENSTFSIAAWTTITPSEFTIQPLEQVIVDVVFAVPSNAEPGGHYGSIVASLSGGTQDVTGSAVGNDRGSLVLMAISGDIEEELSVSEFSAPSFSEYGPIDFGLLFKNNGNVHVIPAGFVTIKNLRGDEVGQLEIPKDKRVLPGFERRADLSWDEKNLIGRYTATLVVNYGSGSQEVLTDSITFTVFPWKVGLGVGVGILAVVLLIVKGRARIKKAAKALVGK